MKLAEQTVTAEAELFEDEKGQSVRLPEGFRFEGERVTVRREGSRLVLEQVEKKKLRTREEIRDMFRRMDALNAGPAIPGGRNQGLVEPKKIFD